MSATISYIASADQDQEAVFIQTEGPKAFREHEPVEENGAVMAIVQLWSGEKFLCREWKDGTHAFVTGGIEPAIGESAEEASKREIAEESGYWHILFRGTLKFRECTTSSFTQRSTSTASFAHFTVVYCMVTDQNARRRSREIRTLSGHVPRWVLRKDVSKAFLSVRIAQVCLEPILEQMSIASGWLFFLFERKTLTIKIFSDRLRKVKENNKTRS